MNLAGRDENLKEMIDEISSEVTSAGGEVETVQKIDKRSFSRVANKRFTSGYYVNIIFTCPSSVIEQLRNQLTRNKNVFRVLITHAATTAAAVEEQAA